MFFCSFPGLQITNYYYYFYFAGLAELYFVLSATATLATVAMANLNYIWHLNYKSHVNSSIPSAVMMTPHFDWTSVHTQQDFTQPTFVTIGRRTAFSCDVTRRLVVPSVSLKNTVERRNVYTERCMWTIVDGRQSAAAAVEHFLKNKVSYCCEPARQIETSLRARFVRSLLTFCRSVYFKT